MSFLGYNFEECIIFLLLFIAFSVRYGYLSLDYGKYKTVGSMCLPTCKAPCHKYSPGLIMGISSLACTGFEGLSK